MVKVWEGFLVRAEVAAECLVPVVRDVMACGEVVFVEVEYDLDQKFWNVPKRVHGLKCGVVELAEPWPWTGPALILYEQPCNPVILSSRLAVK